MQLIFLLVFQADTVAAITTADPNPAPAVPDMTTEEDTTADSLPSQQPPQRGDFCLTTYQNSAGATDIVVMFGFRTYSSTPARPYPNKNSLEDPYPTLPYYLNDIWIYEPYNMLWLQRFVYESQASVQPSARRGAAAVTLGAGTEDPQVLMVGGHRNDDLFFDMWTLNVQRRPKESRTWTRIDPFIRGKRPDPVAYHSMVYSETLDMVVLMGGLGWTSSDLAVTDSVRDLDRRCFKQAKDVATKFCKTETVAPFAVVCDLEEAFDQIAAACTPGAVSFFTQGFCCNVLVNRTAVDSQGHKVIESTNALSSACKVGSIESVVDYCFS
jgi:hypothetical protein